MDPRQSEPGLIAGILLAAGQSARMGRPKALLPYSHHSTFIEAAVSMLRSGGVDPVLVVLGPHPDLIRAGAPLDDVKVVHNADYLKGQLSSLQAGVKTLPRETSAAIVGLVDQPHVSPVVPRLLIEAFLNTRAPIVRPVWQGRGGHPFLISRETFDPLLALGSDATIYDLVRLFRDRRRDVASPEASILEDFDTPEAYENGGFPRD